MAQVQEVLRSWIEDLIGGEKDADFCKRTGLPSSNVSEVINRKGKRTITLAWMQRIVAGYYKGKWSEAFAALGLIAAKMEQAEASAAERAAKRPRRRNQHHQEA